MGKQPAIRLPFVLLAIACTLLLSGGREVQAAPARQVLAVPLPAAAASATVVSSGAFVTQTFVLQAGWNTIYLEVEPFNTSPLVDPDGAGPLPPAPSLSTLEAVFATLNCTDCLESVWSWSVPVSRMDFIIDPAEGLWDQPGWKRYFSPGSIGPDGEPQDFLTDLLTLRANAGYLVKLRDDFVGDATLVAAGRPVVPGHRYEQDSYNLAGFPLLPGATPTVQSFFGASPLTEVYRLSKGGEWEALIAADTLRYGEAYLVYYDSQASTAVEDFTAPVNVVDLLSDGLVFASGLGERSASFRVENLTAQPVSLTVALVDGAAAGVALRLTEPVTRALRTGPAQIELAAGQAVRVGVAILSTEQPMHGEALLAISAPALGVRWLAPVTARSLSLAGLWLGEVVVNDVSESRLGATNVDGGALTVALRQRNLSDVRGAAELQEVVAGNSVATAVTITLALPDPTQVTPPTPVSATVPYVAGYVFVDVNQNGQRDGDEPGVGGVTVTLGGAGAQQTAADGLYLFEGVAAGDHTLTFAPPPGYSSAFEVLAPESNAPSANAVPTQVTVSAEGITAVAPPAYLTQVLPAPHTLPYEDATGARVEPLLNLGLTPVHDVTLWTVGPGGCGDLLQQRQALGQAQNGLLAATLSNVALNPGLPVGDLLLSGASDYAIRVQQAGQEVACGEVVVGAPTRLADGGGSEFRYRILLRVDADGRAELLPYYQAGADLRITSAAFSLSDAVNANGRVTDPGRLLNFSLAIAANDPLNPYRHKYHPDHDNLDARFNAIDLNLVPPHLWESYDVQRRIGLTFTDEPPGVTGAAAVDLAVELDWGGMTWGGLYKEVVQGIHKNAITARGYFVLQHVLLAEDLEPQDYD
jgi:hypothetical protein